MVLDTLDAIEVLGEWTSGDPQDLVTMGISAARAASFERGLIFLAEAYRHLSREKDAKLPAALLSYYGLCLALHRGKIKEGAEFCQLAVEREFYNADHYLNLAQVWQAGRSRRKAVEAIERGLGKDPRHAGLHKLKVSIGLRRRPVLPFLHRDNPLNIRLGKIRHQLKGQKPSRKPTRS